MHLSWMKQKELQYRTNIVQEHYLQYRLFFFFSRTRFLLLQEYYMKLDVREAHEKEHWLMATSLLWLHQIQENTQEY